MKKTIGLIALLAVGLLVLTNTAMAFRAENIDRGLNEERCELMKEIFESNDYEAWRTNMELNRRNTKVLDLVNKENFETFKEAHEAMKKGDYERAKELRAELGLGQGKMHGNRLHQRLEMKSKK